MALTDTALKALKPRDKTYTVSDDRGLYLEVFPTGGMVWRYRYRLNGKYEKLTLGKYPALTLKNARLMRDGASQMAAIGESPAQKKQRAKVAGPEDTTLSQFAERFFKEIQQRDRKNNTMPRRYLDKDILPHIGSKPVKDVTADDIRSVIWRKKEQGFDAAAGQVRGLLKRIFDYALTCGLIQANPVMALPMRHVYRAVARDRALTPDEIRQFLRAMQTSNIRRQFKIAFQLILMTLVRKSELMLAQWKDVHLDEGEWHIPVENSKTGKPHIVYLSTQAQMLFKALVPLASSSVWVLPGRGTLAKPFAHNALNQALKVSLQAQEIPAFTIHDLRRTASTLLHEQGWAADVVEKALNHTIGGVRGVYNRAEYADQRRKMLQAWSDYIDGLAPASNLVV
ncbi:tyrosine-type recombinase/integrase [Burkholderia aenigmatica]|uniref:tyrosine-type recombinase/integrase n=1 Tax=Burkholderia aenigmatica TaxID=2015348 RepID=UPI0026543FF5|nr:tyrosine-type recombinase/integrase [Burkholderia aenigmatica]MDN7880232.1 tyrosine-type recombinase/integrase [Burkholderia aenigmatica]